jgi:phosphoribosyl-AMP cyclohydrolase
MGNNLGTTGRRTKAGGPLASRSPAEQGPGLLDQYLPQGEAWYLAVLYYLAWVVAGLLTTVVVFFAFTVVGNLLSAPFNELLSERIEMLVLGGAETTPFALTRFVAESGRAVYWSRSRARLWRKGEESGHEQTVTDIRLDCDGDTVLLTVEQKGGIACHTGRHHCFFQQLQEQDWVAVEPVLKHSVEFYGNK